MGRLVNLMVRCGADFSSLTKATKKAQTSMSSMQKASGLLKKSLSTLGLTLSAAAVVSFGKACVDAASDLQEVQNVVDTTFGEMSGQIDAFAKTALQQFGLSETAAKQYSGTMGAMLKSMGLTEEQTLGMSKAITGLTGDMASFYNLGADEAFAKIRSGISGETEPLKQLGINMSIANLEAYAMSQGITKAYRSMTPAEQALLRYNYLMHATADAQGDFSRTSGSWANQTRILAEQFNQLKVALGQGLIQALTPVITVINQIMAKLVALAQTFSAVTAKLFGKQTAVASSSAEAVESAASAQNNLADGIAAASKEAKKSLAGFDELNVLQSSAASAGGSTGAASSGTGVGSLMAATEPVEYPLQESIENGIANIDLESMGTSISNLAVNLFTRIKEAISGVDWQEIGNSISSSLAAIDWGGICSAAFGALGAVFGALGGLIIGLLSKAWSSVSDHFTEWIEKSEAAGGNVVTGLLAGILAGLVEIGVWIYEHMVKPFVDAFCEALGIHSPSTVFEEYGGNIVDGLFNGIDATWGKITGFFSGALDKIEEVFSGTWTSIQETASNIWDGIVSVVRDSVNGIIGTVNGMISGVVDGINLVGQTLNAFSFEIPENIPKVGGMKLGFNIPQITAPQIPYLANGAVIPPNSEFLAVLGDQKHGTNIEAPLSTIEEAVSRASGSEEQLRLLRAQNELLRQILDKTGFSVDGKELWSALSPYQRQAERARGW